MSWLPGTFDADGVVHGLRVLERVPLLLCPLDRERSRREAAAAAQKVLAFEELRFPAVRLAVKAECTRHRGAITSPPEGEQQFAGLRSPPRRRRHVPTQRGPAFGGSAHLPLRSRRVPARSRATSNGDMPHRERKSRNSASRMDGPTGKLSASSTNTKRSGLAPLSSPTRIAIRLLLNVRCCSTIQRPCLRSASRSVTRRHTKSEQR